MANMVGTCPFCQGNTFIDEGIRKCFQCSREFLGKENISLFYEHNRAAILDYFMRHGIQKTLEKWSIPQGSISKLLKRWGAGDPPPLVPQPAIKSDNHLPELPAFSNDWSPEVQLKWLEVWAERR